MKVAPLLVLPIFTPVFGQDVIISEFMASNSTGLQDEDSDYEDWIELFNQSSILQNKQINILKLLLKGLIVSPSSTNHYQLDSNK